MNHHEREALLKCWIRLYLKYSHQYFEVCLEVLILHLQNTSVLTASTEYTLTTKRLDFFLHIYFCYMQFICL